MALKEYKAKRNFSVTAEPAGGKPLPKAVKGASRFVIQKHDATRLHYDFRLQMEGVLKSWAVPKGLPWAKGEKHLAVEVEDHPIEYETFEGVIPKGQYGGGTVMVWDKGAYYVYGEKPIEALREGRLHIVLDGQKAKGEWALIRTRIQGDKPQWLLLKARESVKPLSKKLDDQSVKTGRTMQQIAEERDAEWQSNREEEARPSFRTRVQKLVGRSEKAGRGAGRKQTKKAPAADSLLAGIDKLPAAKPRFVDPMKPKLVDNPPLVGDWIYELKFDGIRLLAIKSVDDVKVMSRNKNELGARFGEVVAAVRKLPVQECVIDGEVVTLDAEGRSSFQLLQAREMEGRATPIHYYVFDLLQVDGRDCTRLPLSIRKELLAKICRDAQEPIRFSSEIGSDPKPLLAEVKRRGLEGLIGKQLGSIYESGRRSGAWIKLKCVNEQEFVIGGYTPPGGSRKYFGALLVGYYEGKRLLFAGKVGTGFNTKSLAALHKQFARKRQKNCPFADLPSKQGGKWVQGITPGEMRKCTWVKPAFVCQVKFAEWTRDGKLRQPVFLGLREDKTAPEVRRETAEIA